MIRWLAVGAAVSLALVLAAPGAAQREEPLKELWSEYPLVPKVEATRSQDIGPFLPPSDPEATPISGDPTRWSLWSGFAVSASSLCSWPRGPCCPPCRPADERAREARGRRPGRSTCTPARAELDTGSLVSPVRTARTGEHAALAVRAGRTRHRIRRTSRADS